MTSFLSFKKILIFAAVFILASLFLLWGLRRPTLQSVSLREGEIIEAIYGLGLVQPEDRFAVKLCVSSALTKIYVREGDLVQAGQMLAAFQGTGPARAPFAGTITNVYFREGENIPPQTPVVQLVNLQRKYIEVSLEQEAALRVRPGMLAQVIFDTRTGEKQKGQVRSVFPKDREFIARIDVDQLGEHILPGMSADTVIEVGRTEKALLIPLKAVQSGEVLRLREGEKKKIAVQLGHVDGSWVEVLSGDLKLTDQLLMR